jgi:hypothetical protein
MSLESAGARWRQAAQEKMDEMKESHDTEVEEITKSSRNAKLGGLTLATTVAANIIDQFADFIPSQWEPYARTASTISAAVSISGLAGLKYHAHRAASKARVALAYAIPNEIALPQWTHPYIADNRELFERNQVEAGSPQ